MKLADLIHPRHLDPAATAVVRATIAGDRHRTAVIDGWLTPALHDGLLACFNGDAQFRPHHGLKQAGEEDSPGFEEHAVDADAFAAAPPSRRLARELVLDEAASAGLTTPGWLAHRRFMRMLVGDAFQAWLSAVSGEGPLDDVSYLARTMRHGDMCRAHSDAGDARRLCVLLYLGDGWRPAFGGRFQQLDGPMVDRSIAPLGNRAILHVPARECIHQVEPLTDTARGWRRHSYSLWFGAGPAGS